METLLRNHKIHNLTEDLVTREVDAICDEIEKSGRKPELCTCDQCRLDAACYVLNRTQPSYVVSNRGVARLERETLERRQKDVDLTVLIYKALEDVAHNRRPYFDHRTHTSKAAEHAANGAVNCRAVFNIPVIVGRVFNGVNFEPLSGIDVELVQGGELVAMRDANWQNPYRFVKDTEGTFTFWPRPVEAKTEGERAVFEFTVRIETEGFETLNHFLEVQVVSENFADIPFSMDRTFKLQDLYLFPEGAEEYAD
ncbi:MAG: late competence development ComFB family protein [Spirochaetaceae bacterium]|jgi:competence protein ComFB|nr:late competence development ComFB family protein [Spirochaetaceae bacterium]